MDLIINPIVDTHFDGFSHLEFVPACRVAYNYSEKLALAVEEYAGFGELKHILRANQQFHEVFGVLDYSTKVVNIEFGAGVGLTGASDQFTLKLILSRDLN